MQNRRRFLRSSAAAGVAMAVPLSSRAQGPLFSISLAQWSLNRRIFSGELDALDFPVFTKDTFGIDAVEYVNQFFMDKAQDRAWLGQLKAPWAEKGLSAVSH